MYKASLFILLMALIACNPKQKDTSTSTDTTTTLAHDSVLLTNPKLIAYTQYIKTLNDSTAESVTQAAQKFKEIFQGERSTLCDSAFIVFNTFYEKVERRLDDIHTSDTTNYDSLVANYELSESVQLSPKLLKYNQKLTQNGFQVASTEGTTYIKQDRDLIAKWIYPLVSSIMKDYLMQLNKENKEGFSEDAGIIITPLQLSERVVWWEKFTKSNPQFAFISEGKENYRDYLTYFLEGMDNTRSFYEDNTGKIELDPEFIKAYTHVLTAYPNTETAKLIKPFHLALSQQNLKKVQEILNQYKVQKIIR